MKEYTSDWSREITHNNMLIRTWITQNNYCECVSKTKTTVSYSSCILRGRRPPLWRRSSGCRPAAGWPAGGASGARRQGTAPARGWRRHGGGSPATRPTRPHTGHAPASHTRGTAKASMPQFKFCSSQLFSSKTVHDIFLNYNSVFVFVDTVLRR